MIVRDPEKIRDHGIVGAPDWILEILSDSTSYKDQTEKRNLYEEAGVPEYWILNPDTLDLLVYRLENGRYGAPTGARLDTPRGIDRFPEISLVVSA